MAGMAKNMRRKLQDAQDLVRVATEAMNDCKMRKQRGELMMDHKPIADTLFKLVKYRNDAIGRCKSIQATMKKNAAAAKKKQKRRKASEHGTPWSRANAKQYEDWQERQRNKSNIVRVHSKR